MLTGLQVKSKFSQRKVVDKVEDERIEISWKMQKNKSHYEYDDIGLEVHSKLGGRSLNCQTGGKKNMGSGKKLT